VYRACSYNAAVPRRNRKILRSDPRLTEERLLASRNLDRMSALAIVRLMNREDRKVAAAVKRELPEIARAVDAIVEVIGGGGRLFYVGAGSSGRMAVLDAAECPPTFGIPRNQVQALIAGGRKAVTGAVEGAEDSERNGRRDLQAKGLTPKDIVVGVAASGTTPYVFGALRYAKKTGAKTVALTVNRGMRVARIADFVIAPGVGPEVLTGSTRLKAGTSQKLVLNMLSTASMVRLGHAYQNLMIDAEPTNDKLRKRSVRIVAEASGASVSQAEQALRAAGHSMKVALVMLKTGKPAPAATKNLRQSRGNLRAALGEAGMAAKKGLDG
jgi:N-acetylmuramic acid 6-phosphate etherase